MDWAVSSSIFLRGEYEYIGFGNFHGVNLNIHTIRTALGFRF
jgi:opacity protein-like surface antigen